MTRRSEEQSGWVQFPVKDFKYKNTNEGGMVVKLVVIDEQNVFSKCCGGSVVDHIIDPLVGDHKNPKPVWNDDTIDFKSLDRQIKEWEERHFPNINGSYNYEVTFISRPYLAVLVLGTTGWSGWDEKAGEYWYCKYEDLTLHGKLLYDSIFKLYADCELHLLTFLDT